MGPFIMQLDRRELIFVNSPIRRFFQKYYEFRVFRKPLKRNGIDLTHKVILDAGCGSGYSTELIAKALQPQELVALHPGPLDVAPTLGSLFFCQTFNYRREKEGCNCFLRYNKSPFCHTMKLEKSFIK